MPPTAPRPVVVVAGALLDEQGRVLIARRPHHQPHGGYWEFPGGKLEPGETPAMALARELAEELDVAMCGARPLITVRCRREGQPMVFSLWRVFDYRGTPRPRLGQALAWARPTRLNPARFPAPDRPAITALCLPATYLITPEVEQPRAFLATLARILRRGTVGAVQWRAHRLDDAAYAALAPQVHACCQAHAVPLFLNRMPALAATLPGEGLHLRAAMLDELTARPRGPWRWIGASCHNAAELARAEALGLDYALLSPVRPTASHPGQPALGWPAFAALVATVNLPVYALGGVGPVDLDTAWRHGAQGIAAQRAWWGDD